jgi:hypothetical protein
VKNAGRKEEIDISISNFFSSDVPLGCRNNNLNFLRWVLLCLCSAPDFVVAKGLRFLSRARNEREGVQKVFLVWTLIEAISNIT